MPNINASMVLRMIWTVGLILQVQNTGLFVEGENNARGCNNSCRSLKKMMSCNKQLHMGSDSSTGQNRCTFNTENNNNSLTFHHNFSDSKKEFRVSLLRGRNKSISVCEGSFNSSLLPFDCNNSRVIPSESYVTFYLQNLTEDDTDIYFFRNEVMYPPPYICECDEGTIIHVKDKLFKEVLEIQTLPLSLLIILGCIASYSLIITASFVCILRNRRRTRIQQSEYINVPHRPKNHKPYVPYVANSIHSVTH